MTPRESMEAYRRGGAVGWRAEVARRDAEDRERSAARHVRPPHEEEDGDEGSGLGIILAAFASIVLFVLFH